VIVSATATGSANEWADGSAKETANTPHTAAGSIAYTDANALDTHTASFAARGSSYLGTFSLNTANIDSADTVGWSFTISDSAMDYLNAGQTLKQLYDVTINDGHGGTVVQTITITLRGSSDGSTRTLFGRGNGPDAFEHGQNGMDGDQIPAPHHAGHDSMMVLGAHLHFGEDLV